MEKFNSICRTCNTERSNLVNLSSHASGNGTLMLREVLLLVCPSLPMSERLPQQICYFCSKQLEIAYNFQLLCAKSHEEQWKLIQPTIKRESSPVETFVRDEGSQIDESGKSVFSCAEEEFEESSPLLTEDLEFLVKEEIEESEDIASPVEEPTEEPLKADLATYTESDAPIVCCHCNKKFHTHKGLQLHEKLTHKNLKPILLKAEILTIECKYCLQVFEKRSELLVHCRLKHKKPNDLTCDFCQKTFSRKNRFRYHLLYHGKERYMCTVKDCNRVYIIKYKLTDHLRRFHGINISSSEIKALQPTISDES